MWIRTCQECGLEQETKSPKNYKDQKSESGRNKKCKRCKSESLDYGSEIVEVDRSTEELE